MTDLPVPSPPTPTDDALERVRRRVEKLANLTFDHCEQVMAVGTPAAKMAVAKNILPQLIKALGEQREVDAHAEMREALADMREALRATVATQVAVEVVEDDEVDLPVDAS